MKSNKTRFCIFLVGPVHCPQNLQVQILTNFSLKLSHTALFTHLKIIFIIVFSVFSNKRYPNRSLVSVWQRLFLSIYFTIQLIFYIIYGFYCTFRYCGPVRSATQPKLYLGPEPVPRGYLAEDEWSVTNVAKGTAEDLPYPRHSRATIERPTPRCRQSPNGPL